MQPGNNMILIVDDDARNIFALNAVLKAKGFKCLTCTSGKDVLPLLKSNPQIGIILLDMMMPEMDGYELLSLLRTHTTYATLPVLAVTAQAMAGDKEKCIAAGANDYVSKPINTDILLTYLNKYLHA